MSIFDKLKSTAQQAVSTAAQSIGSKRETFTFTSLPESLAEMQALPEASLDTPFKTAALTVLALCAYAADRNIGTEMLNWLRGPRPLNGQQLAARSASAERTGHFFPERPFPRRKDLPAFYLFRRFHTGQ